MTAKPTAKPSHQSQMTSKQQTTKPSTKAPNPMTAKSNAKPSHRPQMTSKPTKPTKSSTGVCNNRRKIAFEEVKGNIAEIRELIPDYSNVTTLSDVTELCAFKAPTLENQRFNQGCPFLYFPTSYNDNNWFHKGVEEYKRFYPRGVKRGAVQALASVALYCSCYQVQELECPRESPHTLKDKNKYCEFVGVWNGDINITDVDLSRDMLDCGCFMISEAPTDVGHCPGVDLGYFFRTAEIDTDIPTYNPTFSPTTSPAPTLTSQPSGQDTYSPTLLPTLAPTLLPTLEPTM